MTGPAPGKIRINAIVILVSPEGFKHLDAEVYIHLKGYSRARVTHLDVETPLLNNIIAAGSGGFFPARGDGVEITVEFHRLLKGFELSIRNKVLAENLLRNGERTWVYVGGKPGGLFIGFKKQYILRLEEIALKYYAMKPR